MLRSDSSSKWKEVLGFDDGLPVSYGPRPYSATPERDSPETSLSPAPAYLSRFPGDIAFTRTKQHDLYLSSSSSASSSCIANTGNISHTLKPLFYATIQQDTSPPTVASPKPDIILHNGTNKSAAIISLAAFHPATQTTDITLCPLPPPEDSDSKSSTSSGPEPKNFSLPSHRRLRTEKLVPTGGIFTTEKHGFYHTFRNTLAREKFEWRQVSASTPMLISGVEGTKDKETGGLKLVRISMAESVAVYAPVRRE